MFLTFSFGFLLDALLGIELFLTFLTDMLLPLSYLEMNQADPELLPNCKIKNPNPNNRKRNPKIPTTKKTKKLKMTTKKLKKKLKKKKEFLMKKRQTKRQALTKENQRCNWRSPQREKKLKIDEVQHFVLPFYICYLHKKKININVCMSHVNSWLIRNFGFLAHENVGVVLLQSTFGFRLKENKFWLYTDTSK